MQNIYIRDLMTRNVTCVNADAELDEVIELMRLHAFSCIVIVENDKPVGIITERDMVKILSEVVVCPVGELYVKDFMSEQPICLHESATLYEALVISHTRAIRHFPIINDEAKLIGLVTQSDISQAHFRAVEKQRAIIEEEIQDRTRQLTDANEELKALALQDSQLRIGNRRSMEVDAHFTHANAVRYCRPYAVAVLEFDNHKRYKSCYSAQHYDEALVNIVRRAKDSVRTSDRLYRYSDGEFLLLMPETFLFEAVEAVHRVLENVARLAIPHKKNVGKIVTFSAGIGATIDGKIRPWDEVLAEATEFLSVAKENGGNQAAWQVPDFDQAATPWQQPRLF